MVKEKKIYFNLTLLFSILIVATTLRAPLTSVGPLVSEIKTQFMLNGSEAGFISTLPLFAFAIVSPLAPKIANKLSLEKTILIAVIMTFVGIVIRSMGTYSFLLFGTAIMGVGIAVCNVLIPGLVKKEFTQKSGFVTGLYSISMNLFGAVASGVSIPMANMIGWKSSLLIWSSLSVFAFFAWLPQLKYQDLPSEEEQLNIEESVWQSSLAWAVTMFMGLQSLIFYVLVAWLPTLLISKGVNPTESGILLSAMQLILLPMTFIIPIFAEKLVNQIKLVVMTVIAILLGITCLIFNGTILSVLSVLFLGIGCGSAFGLAMIFLNIRSKTSKKAAELSGMSQSVGYLLAAMGPILFGYFHDLTNDWMFPLFMLIILTILLFLSGLLAGQNKKI